MWPPIDGVGVASSTFAFSFFPAMPQRSADQPVGDARNAVRARAARRRRRGETHPRPGR